MQIIFCSRRSRIEYCLFLTRWLMERIMKSIRLSKKILKNEHIAAIVQTGGGLRKGARKKGGHSHFFT